MIIEGLRAAKRTALADTLAERTLSLIETGGFYEYFDPRTGEGLGAPEFGWSAALTNHLLAGT